VILCSERIVVLGFDVRHYVQGGIESLAGCRGGPPLQPPPGQLGLRPRKRVLIIAELLTRFRPGESPVDLDLIAVDPAVPGTRLAL
jgi:hypothetical protein